MPDRPFSSFVNRMATFSSYNVLFLKVANIMDIRMNISLCSIKVKIIIGERYQNSI